MVGARSFGAQALVGRETLLTELVPQVLAQRLLTLVGPGGVGKTSIAQHIASAPDFAGGVRLVELAAVRDGHTLPQAVASACGLTDQRGTPWLETLIAALHDTESLLILDNCEHLRDACAALCTRLLAECLQLHILATSREPLGLAAETVIPIPPLDAAGAAELFGLRAGMRRAGFHPDAAAIALICQQLDGIPLAIELAAARVSLLNAGQIAERMQHSLDLLASRDATRPLRQRSLRATLDWSYALLNVDEQHLFGQLAVFAGTFDLAAVEAISTLGQPLDALTELVDQSLVVVTQRDQVVRYRLHEVVRQYAAERLAATGEQVLLRNRHLVWAIALAEHAEQTFETDQPDLWLANLRREAENIRHALQTADEMADGFSVLRLAGALAQFWNNTSIGEGRDWLARGFARASAEPGLVSVKAWNTESFLAYRQGDYEAMRHAAQAALAAALTVESAKGIADARYRLGIYAEMKGETAEANQQYQQSFSLYRELGNRRGMSQTLNGLAHVAKNVGNFAEAQEYYSQGLTIARADGDRLTIALLLISLANLRLDAGELDAAKAAYAESLAHLRVIDHRSYILYALSGLGGVAHHQHDFATANAYHTEGLEMARALGLHEMKAQFLAHLGFTAIATGAFAEAAAHLSESLQLYLVSKRTLRIAGTIHYCASLLVRLGYPAQATSLFVAGLRVVEAEDFAYLGNESAEIGAIALLAREALTPAAYALAAADGAALTLTQAADLALSAVYLPQRPLPSLTPPELQIYLFGNLRVIRAGRELTSDDWVYSKPRDLLLFLLLVDSADKAEIGAALWPDASPEQLKQNFRVAIYHLRRALGRSEWISFRGGRYAFNRTPNSWVDLDAFEQATEQAVRDQAQRTTHLRIAAALYTGELALGELESDVPLIRRERLLQQALTVLLELGDTHLHMGQYNAAANAYRRVLVLDAYAEAAERGLLRSLARQGEHATALAHYQQFAALLDRDLGVTPTAETAALAAQIQAGIVF